MDEVDRAAQQQLLQPTEASSIAPAPPTLPNGTHAEDIDMAEPISTIAPPQDPAALTEASAIAPDSLSTMPQMPQAPPAPSPAAVPAPSSRNSPHPTAPQQPPVHATLHGAPFRQYLNQRITPHLLEGMKHLATLDPPPEKPLRWLSEFLASKSDETEV